MDTLGTIEGEYYASSTLPQFFTLIILKALFTSKCNLYKWTSDWFLKAVLLIISIIWTIIMLTSSWNNFGGIQVDHHHHHHHRHHYHHHYHHDHCPLLEVPLVCPEAGGLVERGDGCVLFCRQPLQLRTLRTTVRPSELKTVFFRALDKSFKGVLTHFCPIVYQISNRNLNISCFFLNRNIRWYQIHIVILIQIYSDFDDDDQEAWLWQIYSRAQREVTQGDDWLRQSFSITHRPHHHHHWRAECQFPNNMSRVPVAIITIRTQPDNCTVCQINTTTAITAISWSLVPFSRGQWSCAWLFKVMLFYLKYLSFSMFVSLTPKWFFKHCWLNIRQFFLGGSTCFFVWVCSLVWKTW